MSYKIQTVEVNGDLSDIIDLFVRINSTGKALSSSEKRHAKYYNCEFLRHAQRLARRFQRYFLQQQIIGEQQITRMKDVELVSELLAALAAGQPLHAKAAVDRAISNEALHGQTLRRVIADFVATIRLTKRLLPELRATRFHNMSEFYSLFLVVAELRAQKMILADRKRNRVAADLIRQFSNEVDAAYERQRAAKGVPAGKQLMWITSCRRNAARIIWVSGNAARSLSKACSVDCSSGKMSAAFSARSSGACYGTVTTRSGVPNAPAS